MRSMKNKPQHVAIVMDGNGRWANSRKLKRTVGHQAGISAVKSVVKSALINEIDYVTLFAFGQDNWKRSQNETGFLMQLFYKSLEAEYKKLHHQGVRLVFIGQLDVFSEKLQRIMARVESLTSENRKLTLVIAVNYSGQWDILQANQKFFTENKRCPSTLLELESRLVTANFPTPDLFIRTSGEQRISNFMLWQLAYTELYFTDIFWPDFDEHAFEHALSWFDSRKRRFGNIDE